MVFSVVVLAVFSTFKAIPDKNESFRELKKKLIENKKLMTASL